MGLVTDADGNSMAVVSVTVDNSDGPTSTGVGTDGTTSTRAIDSDGGATSEKESSSRLISVEDSFDIVGGGPRTGASPTRVIDSSERSREQEGETQGTSRLGTRHPVTTSNDYPTYYTQAGRQSDPDNKSNPVKSSGYNRTSFRASFQVMLQ